MKYFIAILLAVLWLNACNVKQENTHAHSEESHTENADGVYTLQLNNGEKWVADEATKRNVDAMAQIVSGDMPADADTYIAKANELQTALQTMINECRMQGPDHDALHLWLEPLMAHVKQLGGQKDVQSAAMEYNKIKEQIKLFDTYFAVR